MQINEEEAKILLGAVQCSYFEQGGNPEDDPLVQKIYRNFPAIKREVDQKKLRDHLWSVVAEQDPKVIELRKKLENTDYKDPDYEKIQVKFFKIKGEVFKELWSVSKDEFKRET